MDIIKNNHYVLLKQFNTEEIANIVATDNESKKENYEYVTKLDYQEEKVNRKVEKISTDFAQLIEKIQNNCGKT